MMTVKLLQKDYVYLANCLVPVGDQIAMTQQEIADMLRTKTKRFTEEDIRLKFPDTKAGRMSVAKPTSGLVGRLMQDAAGLLPVWVLRARVKEE